MKTIAKRRVVTVVRIDIGMLAYRVRAAGRALFHYIRQMARTVRFRPSEKRIHISESLSLGGKRFIALVRVDNREFLIGGGSDSVVQIQPTREPQPTFFEALPNGNSSLPREYSIQ